jgi:hypothetical protein
VNTGVTHEFLIDVAVHRAAAVCGLDGDHMIFVKGGIRVLFAPEGGGDKILLNLRLLGKADVATPLTLV